MSPYTYSPLDTAQAELRLIRLLPGNVDDNISLNIFHVPLPFPQQAIDTRMRLQELQRTLPHNCLAKETLDGRYLFMTLGTAGVPNTWDHPDPNFDRSLYEKREQSSDYKPKYEALSYTWGITEDAPSQEESPVIPYVAQVLGDNGESQGNLALGDNLAKALKHLRYRDRPRALWTDAICINQADIQERSAQVKRMCDIYSLAERVVLWLGPEENGSAHAIRTLDYFSKQVEYVVDGSIGDAPGAEQLKWWQSSFPLPYDERTWSALVAIFRRSWFTRVWVLQEAQLASASSIVQCGLDTVPWASLRKSMFALVDREGAPTELRLLFSNYTDGVTGNKDHIFKSLLSWARSRDCTDPRDRVYGILGLAPQSVTDKLQPNYSVSAAEVYRDTLLAYTAAYTSLDLLQQCRISHRCRKAPSWIPNWSEIVRHTFFSHELGYARSSASVSAPSIEYIAPRTLRVTGTLCGHIEPGSRVIDGNIQQILEGIHKWAPESIHTSTYVTGEPFFDSFIDLLCLGRTADYYTYALYLPSLEERKSQYRTLREMNLAGQFAAVLEDVREICLFSTRDGYIGAAPVPTLVGDKVCVLLGCSTPIILRPTYGGHLVVGPCYVPGLMNGEALVGPMPKPWKAQVHIVGSNNVLRFINTETKSILSQDPRLPPRGAAPRLSPEALKERGIILETYNLR